LGATHAREVEVSRIFPPREDEGRSISTSVRIPTMMLDKIDRIAKEEKCSRTEAMLHLWRYAIQEWEEDRKQPARIAK
jgi:metal-responsive CopG/Arc/MetJ family transcriptional regulator